MLLTAVIITKNEERNIARCLESIKDVADEIVVVDSGSTDNTEKTCKSFNVRFVQQDWLGYSEQKNFANNLASNDWILSIDADEELSEKLKNSISELKNQRLHLRCHGCQHLRDIHRRPSPLSLRTSRMIQQTTLTRLTTSIASSPMLEVRGSRKTAIGRVQRKLSSAHGSYISQTAVQPTMLRMLSTKSAQSSHFNLLSHCTAIHL